MPRDGDFVVYCWFPLGQRIPMHPGPYAPELDLAEWERGRLRPSDPDLPRPSLDISLLLRECVVRQRATDFELSTELASTLLAAIRSRRARLRRRPKRPAARRRVTVVEAAITLPEAVVDPKDPDADRQVTSAIDSALALCRELLLTASSENHFPVVLPSLETLPEGIIVVLAQHKNGELVASDSPLGLIPNPLHAALAEIEGSAADSRPRLIGFPNLFRSYQALRNDAEVALYTHGQYRSAVVLAAAAAEAFVSILAQCLLYEEGMSSEAGARLMAEARGLKKWAERVLGPRIRGQWDGRTGSAVSDWVGHLIHPRNQVMHSGVDVTRSEAISAVHTLGSFRRWVGQQVFNHRKKYPLTALAMSLGMMMAPEGSSGDPMSWLASRLDEAGESFVEYMNGFEKWQLEMESHRAQDPG
jgi:hypothetical protein